MFYVFYIESTEKKNWNRQGTQKLILIIGCFSYLGLHYVDNDGGLVTHTVIQCI